MSIKNWLKILALSLSCTIFSSQTRAEEIVQELKFNDPLEQYVPGRKVDAKIKVSAKRIEKTNKIQINLEGIDCEIVPGSCTLGLALPHDISISNISQEAWRKKSRLFRSPINERIELLPNESYQRAVKILDYLGQGVLGKATSGFGILKKIDDLAYLAIKGKTRSEINEEELKKKIRNMSLTYIPEFTPKNPFSANQYYYSRNTCIETNNPSELGFAVISVVVVDKNYRSFSVRELVLSLDPLQRTIQPIIATKITGKDLLDYKAREKTMLENALSKATKQNLQ